MYILSRASSIAFKILILFFVLAWLITKGPWMVGSAVTQSQINSTPELAVHLESYSQAVQQLSFVSSWADIARPIATIINDAKRLGLWEPLLTAAENIRPQLRPALTTLAEFADTILRLQQEFNGLSRVSNAAYSLRLFRQAPGEMTLRPLAPALEEGASALDAIRQELLKIDPLVISVAHSIADIVDFLQKISNDWLFGEAARSVLQPVMDLSNSISQYINQLDMIEEQISQDIDVLHTVAQTANNVTAVDQRLRSTAVFGPALAIMNNGLALVAVLIGLLLCWVLFGLADRLMLRRPVLIDRSHEPIQSESTTVKTAPRQSVPAPVVTAANSQPVARPSSQSVVSSQPTGRPVDPSRSSKRLSGTLILQRSGSQTDRFLLPPAGQFVIGRDKAVDLSLGDPLIHDRHAIIRPARTAYFVEVVDPGHQVYVNGQPISQARKLSDGDVIRVGGTMLVIALQSELA